MKDSIYLQLSITYSPLSLIRRDQVSNMATRWGHKLIPESHAVDVECKSWFPLTGSDECFVSLEKVMFFGQWTVALEN
jgi:hypothetical protein